MIASEDEARTFIAARCDAAAMARLERLVALLVVENEAQNLVAANSLGSVWQRHIADSIQLVDFVPRETLEGPLLDLGSGAGFPGLALAAVRPEWSVRLVESRKRRCEWLNFAAGELSLANAEVITSRLEDVTTFEAHVITARAFAPLPKLVELAQRFSTSDTLWLLPKGRSAAQEVCSLPQQWQSAFHVEQSHTGSDSGIVVGRIGSKSQ